jgi:ribonucleoside-diphosphate reductase alpha chain
MYGPQVPFSEEIHAEKYRGEGEDFREAKGREAGAMCDGPDHFQTYREIVMTMRYMAAGRVQAAMGSSKNVTAHNCFVSGTFADSFVDDPGNIMERAHEAAKTMRMGGGIGYDFSPLRPHGALIKKLMSYSSGPISFMEIFDAICKCVASSGHRRGAQMGVLRIDHPDIQAFIRCKQNIDSLTGFNISVGVTNEFMECLRDGKPFALRFEGEIYNYINPVDLWEELMRSTYDWAEPGILFIDHINDKNNLYYCEYISATNPCGEQPLPPFGACLLGSWNLVKYVYRAGTLSEKWEFDWDQLKADIPAVVRAMDNVIDRSTYPLPEQELEAKNKRRMGLGVTGVANALETLGLPYGSPEYVAFQDRILEFIANHTYQASALLAGEKGIFPLYDEAQYLAGQFVQTLWPETLALIKQNGIRNSHLLSIAPTGTISLSADNVSSGIEPVFAYSFDRTVQKATGPVTETIEDYGVRVFGTKGKKCSEVTVDEHLAVLASAQRWVDSAVSKTCNVPTDIPWDEFKSVYYRAWEMGCKGITTFRLGGMRDGIMVEKEDDGSEANIIGEIPEEEKPVESLGDMDYASCVIDPRTGKADCG